MFQPRTIKDCSNKWVKVWQETRHVHSVKLSPCTVLIHCQRKNSNVAEDKSDRHHCIPVGKIHQECDPGMIHRGRGDTTSLSGVCVPNAEPQSHRGKTPVAPKMKNIPEDKGSKVLQSWKTKTEGLSQTGGDQGGTIYTVWNPRTILEQKKAHWWDSGKVGMRAERKLTVSCQCSYPGVDHDTVVI